MGKTVCRLLMKSDAIPPGAHWITVHSGSGTGSGQPILIQPQPDGSAKVIGGAGGSMNHLRLRAVKSHSDYKSEASERQAEKNQKKKDQTTADKAAGTFDAKKDAKKDIQSQKRAAEKSVIQAVAKKAGWSDKDLEFPAADYEHLSEGALNKVKARHHQALLSRAKEVIRASREKLLNDASARSDAGIGELPLFSEEPEAVSVADLDPVKPVGSGLGFQADYKGRSENAGLSPDALKTETMQTKLAGMNDEQRKAAFARGAAADLIKKELEGIKEPAAPKADASLLSAKDALDLVREGKKLSLIGKAAKAANADIDSGAAEPKAFVLETTDDVDEAVKRDLTNDLRTMSTVGFLAEVGKIAGGNPLETLGSHVGVGAYNSINALALAVGGSALVDRSVVDVLGIAGAAQVLARRVHADMTSDEARHVAEGIQDFHLSHYMAAANDAVKKARALADVAKEIDLSEDAVSGSDLAVAQELNARRRSAVGDAQRILGQSLGEMEANAALVVAMRGPGSGTFQVSLGKSSIESAIQQVRAIGLQDGDYTIEKVAGDTFLSVAPEGMSRLAKPISREDVQQVSRNLGIIRGDDDEDGWLPLGVASRPDLAMDVKAGTAERMAQPFAPGDDLRASLRSYIGARAADGDAPADILSDVQSADFFQKVGADRADEYRKALDVVAPLKGADGKQQRAEALTDTFDQYADSHVAALGGKMTTLNRQKFNVDQHSVDALHRALAETPEGTAAYKQIGEMTPKDQGALREFFYRNIAKESPESGQLRKDLEAHHAAEPEKETTDMFGDATPNPEHQDWKSKRDDLTGKLNAGSLTWGKYLKTMGGNERAYESVQDVIRSKMAATFVDAHNKLNPASPMKLGKRVIRNNLDHLDAVDPVARDARMAKDKALVDSLRTRVGGKYASGSVADKVDAAKQQQAAYEQAQMGFFSSDDIPDASAGGQPAALGADERHTLGHAAERQMAGMMGHVGPNFKPGQPTKLWNVSMSGKYAAQQRAIKYVTANKRMVLAASAGSGKTNVMLGAHAHLSGLGKVKRSIMMVPSVVQGQFGGEALRTLEAGKFKAHIQPGASQAERIAAYKDPTNDICVMTHHSFRDDMLHLGAQHAGIDEPAMTEKVAGMSTDERRDWVAGVMGKEGIHFDASFIDEAHDTLNRAGKENSSISNVLEAVGHHTPYHVYASGDPVKNDASEVHSVLQKMDPARYADRAEFMRRYGADTIASKTGLQREMARYSFPTSITPDVAVSRKRELVKLSDGQNGALKELDKHLAAMRIAKNGGKVNVDAAKGVSPGSFDGVPEEDHETVAANLQKSMGILRNSAINRIINQHPDNAKVNHAVEMVKARPGKQGVIFARNRASVEQYKTAMEKAGKKVVVITGTDSPKEKDRKRRLFNPDDGSAPQADIMVASDAAAVGLNLQSGQYLIQHDISDTAKTHSQRNARINRIGQKNGVELIDLHADHKEERRSSDRLEKKYALKNMMASPLDGLDDTGVAGAIKARRDAEQGDQGGLF
jgi:superfamily II DNA or RNA helicase